MADAWNVIGDVVKVLAGGAVGWFLHAAKEWYGRKELRNALYRELADNYTALLYNCAEDRLDFDWLRDNLKHHLAFHAYKKAAANPKRFTGYPNTDGLNAPLKNWKNVRRFPWTTRSY